MSQEIAGREAAGEDVASGRGPVPGTRTRRPWTGRGGGGRRAVLLRRYGTVIGFVALLVLFSALRPAAFLSAANFRNILEQVAVLGIVAAAQTVVMSVGDFDLSVGALASLVGVVAAGLLVGGAPVVVVLVIALALGALAGALNGALVAYMKLSAFIATLATMTAFGGLALRITDGATVFGLPEAFVHLGQGAVGPVPIPILVVAAVALLTWVALSQTTLGRRWYAVGGNPEATMLAGVNVDLVRFTAFVVSGAGAAAAGLVLTARLATAHPTAGDPLMLTSIAAVFLGMTMFKDGVPNLPGTLVGVLIVGVLSNGLNILQVNSYVQQVLTGLIIIVAVAASGLAGRRR